MLHMRVMDLLERMGVAEEDRVVFRTVEEKLSYCLAAEKLGLTEGRLRHRFFRACLTLQKDPKGRERVSALMQKMAAK